MENLAGLVVAIIQRTTGVVPTVEAGSAVADRINDVVVKMDRAL